MNQEDKKLLLKDLCARLPYGVKVLKKTVEVNEICELDSILTSKKHKDNIFVSLTLPNDSVMTGIEMVKPYLRPMSSMTEEEKKELNDVTVINYNEFEGGSTLFDEEGFDWLNAHHFDYRGLIEKGLAIEAPEIMYKHFGDMDVVVTSVEHKDKL